jgi:hypothetical protein
LCEKGVLTTSFQRPDAELDIQGKGMRKRGGRTQISLRGLMLVVFISGILLYVFFVHSVVARWIGTSDIVVHIRVEDSQTGEPVSEAVVVIQHPRRAKFSQITDRLGRASITAKFDISGTARDGVQIEPACVDVSGWEAEVTLGRETLLRTELEAFTGQPVKFVGNAKREMRIKFRVKK